MTKIFEELKRRRGITEEFLHPKYEDLNDPFELPEMEAAVERLKKAAERGEKVIIYGDYDVDGVTASTEMAEILELIGVSTIEIMLPNRFEDGYGMSKKVIERAVETGATLVVTVDCGSNNGEVISELSRNGIDVVVTDHHEVSGELPKAEKKIDEPGGIVVVVNPKRADFRKKVLQRQAEILAAEEAKDEDGDGVLDRGAEVMEGADKKKDLAGLAELCGAGVAFMVAKACVKKGWIREGREKWLLDLAMIGTICDSMKITGDNRIICYYGMIVLDKRARNGLKELMRAMGKWKVNTEMIAFGIGPRLNAAGRMRSADLALNLLRSKTKVEAAKLAKELNDLNSLRRLQQERAMAEVAKTALGSDNVIVVEGAWHEGVIGIIAGKLVESYHRPTFVISNDNRKGSGRSFGDFSLATAISECEDLLEKGGGHAEAAGITLKEGKTEEFRKRINQYYDKLKLKDQERYLRAREDMVVTGVGEMTLTLAEELSTLEPYGEGNAVPVFKLENMRIVGKKKMGKEENHLRLTVMDEEGVVFELVAFNALKDWLEVEIGEVDVWVRMMVNSWNGETRAQGEIVRLEAR